MKRPTLIGLVFLIDLFFNLGFTTAEDNVVRAVLFFSPTCPHCHKVMEEDLPLLAEKYQEQLVLLTIDVTNPQGQELYRSMVEKYQLSEERLVVPTLVVGEIVLVGSGEIPAEFPGIIENGLASGGIAWPDIPGIQELTPKVSDPSTTQTIASNTISGKFLKDPLGNSLAVIILVAMIASVIVVGYQVVNATPPYLHNIPKWIIPGLCILGFGVAGYLSYIELSQTTAICGPVGDCNTVQQSPYAYLFGVIPIGVLGSAGYLAILAGWGLGNIGPKKYRNIATKITWGLSIFGVFFMIYLTFLEPFVIGAVCAWCLGTSVIMTLIFWSASVPVLNELSLS